MAKTNFLLVNLNEAQTKKLAETITSDTSRKILNHLAEKEDAEAAIAQTLALPISTVHYHLQKLQEAGLVTVEEFHYSSKGREINHYKLANKYIIIAPQHVSGLREKLKGILPVAIMVAGMSVIIAVLQKSLDQPAVATSALMESAPAAEMALPAAEKIAYQAAPEAVFNVVPAVQTNWALWFFLGGLVAIVLYLLVSWLREKVKGN